ncbi:MAG TPA: ABC transporter permease [Acidobacteriaceae bacterium]|jgi:predicted permease
MSLLRRFTNLFSRSRVENDIDAELEAHLDLRIADNISAGMSAADARRDALLRFGNPVATRERVVAMDTSLFLETLWFDIRYALRQLRKAPGFTITAVLTLTLAIGANAVVFGALNAIILRPLNVPRPENLYGIERGDELGFQSYPNYVDLRDRNRSFESLAVFSIAQAVLDTGNNPSRGWDYEVSGNYFDTLGAQPSLGRFFHATDEHGPNSAPYVVLSHSYWHSHFQDDPTIIGRTVQVNKHPLTVIGVARPGFTGSLIFFSPDFFIPMVDHDQVDSWSALNDRGNRWIFEVFGHLRRGVTPAQAVTDLNTVGAYLEKSYPKDFSHQNFSLARPGLYGNFLGRPVRGFVAGLMLLSGLILLAACANLGSLFAARASDRSREVALRLALGSSRSRILRQLMTEAVLISVAGGAFGLAAGVVLLHRLHSWQPFPQFPINIPVAADAKVYVVAFFLAIVSGILFGIVPIRQVLHANPYEVVKAGSAVRLGRRVTVRDVLLVLQIALCAVLVTSSAVAIRGLLRSLHSNFGFDPRNVLVASIDFSSAGYAGDDVIVPMQKRLIDSIASLPGVTAVATVNIPPLEFGGAERKAIYKDETRDLRASNSAASPYMYIVSPNYFAAARTTLFAGRTFSLHDDPTTPRVAIVNREFVRSILGSETDAIGRYFKFADGTRFQVIGIVEDGKYLNLAETQAPAFFLPVLQMPWNETSLLIRSSRDPQELAAVVRAKIRELDPGIAAGVQTWTRDLDGALFPSRVATVALGILGVMGAMLSITGIFGMAAYSVSKRFRELGIRVALGAQRREVLGAALGRALKLLAFGSIAGLILGLLATRILAFIVYQASARDPIVLAAVILAMAFLGLVATWLPAQRALSIDPLILLREE